MSVESFIQLLAEGAGKKVRAFRVTSPTAVDVSGNAVADTVAYHQATTLTDGRGDEIKTDEVLTELRAIHQALDIIAMRLE